jgi:energy-converting hydrogenase B subunit D
LCSHGSSGGTSDKRRDQRPPRPRRHRAARIGARPRRHANGRRSASLHVRSLHPRAILCACGSAPPGGHDHRGLRHDRGGRAAVPGGPGRRPRHRAGRASPGARTSAGAPRGADPIALESIAPLQAATLVLVACGATAVALSFDPLRQIFLSGVYGLLLAVLFLVLQAPDVSLSMLVVSTVAYPLIVLIAISRTRRERGKD